MSLKKKKKKKKKVFNKKNSFTHKCNWNKKKKKIVSSGKKL
jgi:hypothetical protein